MTTSTRAGNLTRWVLLDGNRFVLASAIVVAGFLLFVWLGYDVFAIERRQTPMLYLFSALVGGNVTLITIVVTINQLVLARELRSPREVEMELESAEEYRESVEDELGRSSVPERPPEFLRLLVADTRRRVAELDSVIDELPESSLGDELGELSANLGTELDETLDQLETERGGVFSALSTVLDADFSTRLNHSRWIRQLHGEELSEETVSLLGDVERQIEQLDVARQYFKTIYIKQELADVSRLVMYTGLVAVFVALGFLVTTGYGQTPFGPLTRVVLVPAAVAINLVPLSLLVAHVVRITTVARRTAAITPFISPGE